MQAYSSGYLASSTSKLPHSAMNVNQNDIWSYLPYIFVWDNDIRLTVEETQDLIAPRNHDLTDTAAALVKLHVTDPS